MSLLDLLPRVKLGRECDVGKKVAIGTGIGLTVGAVAGVLLAPKACNEKLSGLNEDILKGKWHQLKGGIKAKWGELTDDDLAMVDGQSEKLMGTLQTKYGYSKEKAQQEYDSFINANK